MNLSAPLFAETKGLLVSSLFRPYYKAGCLSKSLSQAVDGRIIRTTASPAFSAEILKDLRAPVFGVKSKGTSSSFSPDIRVRSTDLLSQHRSHASEWPQTPVSSACMQPNACPTFSPTASSPHFSAIPQKRLLENTTVRSRATSAAGDSTDSKKLDNEGRVREQGSHR